ncbi:MAG: hypothetical protein V4662_03410 [Verrucomicrobiota bacterium]
MSMQAAAPTAGRTLVIYGSFGAGHLRRAVTDWTQAAVLEVDACVPATERGKCAAIVTVPPLIPAVDADMLQARADHLLDLFLEERVTCPGLLTSRRFRAACLSINALRIVAPHIVCLEYARRLLAQCPGPWKEVIVSPGAGVSLRAAEQLARALKVPLKVMPFDREKPPALWMLKRKWQRASTLRKQKQAAGIPARLPAAAEAGGSWCCDPRLEAAVARTDEKDQWVKGPGFGKVDPAEQDRLRGDYECWWSAWMQDWQREHATDDPLSDLVIMDDLGQWFSREVYPLHALLLQQAEAEIRKGKPERILIGSMRGRQELLWGIAAQDAGIPVAVYTVDCHIDTRLCFAPDLALCDDRRQWDIATQQTSLRKDQVVKVRSHRKPQAATSACNTTRARKRIVLADSYYSGVVPSSSPLLSRWAFEQTIEAARQMPEHDFIIKFHPIRERPEKCFHFSGLHHLHLWHRDRFIAGLKPPANVTFMPPETRLSDEMADADLLLNIQSYAALEAFAQGTPVIYVQPIDEEGLYPRMREQGVMQIAQTVDRLVHLIRLNLADAAHVRHQLEVQRRYLEDFYWSEGPSLAQGAMISG